MQAREARAQFWACADPHSTCEWGRVARDGRNPDGSHDPAAFYRDGAHNRWLAALYKGDASLQHDDRPLGSELDDDLYTLGDELEDEREACEADGGDEADADAGDEEEMSDSSEAAQLEAAAPKCSAAPSGLTEEQYIEAVGASMGLEDCPQGTEQPPIDGEEQPDGELLFSNGGCAPPLPGD